MDQESSSDDQPRDLSPPEVPKTPMSQVSGQDSAPSEGEKEVQSEPVKDEEEPREGEAKEAQPESTAVRQEEQIDQEVETSWVPQGCTALRVPIFGKGAKGGKGPGKGAEGGKGG